MSTPATLACRQCDYTAACGAAAKLEWLGRLRMVRRDSRIEPDLIDELFRASIAKLRCPSCGGNTLHLETDSDDDESWGMRRRCEQCRQPIAPERLEALPHARLCARCQAESEHGESGEQAEYCPRCGNVMTVRMAGGSGLTRYVMTCSKCKR